MIAFGWWNYWLSVFFSEKKISRITCMLLLSGEKCFPPPPLKKQQRLVVIRNHISLKLTEIILPFMLIIWEHSYPSGYVVCEMEYCH